MLRDQYCIGSTNYLRISVEAAPLDYTLSGRKQTYKVIRQVLRFFRLRFLKPAPPVFYESERAQCGKLTYDFNRTPLSAALTGITLGTGFHLAKKTPKLSLQYSLFIRIN